MSDYLSHLVTRHLNPAASLQPRLPSRFETAPTPLATTLEGTGAAQASLPDQSAAWPGGADSVDAPASIPPADVAREMPAPPPVVRSAATPPPDDVEAAPSHSPQRGEQAEPADEVYVAPKPHLAPLELPQTAETGRRTAPRPSLVAPPSASLSPVVDTSPAPPVVPPAEDRPAGPGSSTPVLPPAVARAPRPVVVTRALDTLPLAEAGPQLPQPARSSSTNEERGPLDDPAERGVAPPSGSPFATVPAPTVRPPVPVAPRPEPPIIRVSIGRVEVRAMMPPTPPQPRPPSSKPPPSLSLDDYLKQRDGGRR